MEKEMEEEKTRTMMRRECVLSQVEHEHNRHEMVHGYERYTRSQATLRNPGHY
jgi:hypothetical protein